MGTRWTNPSTTKSAVLALLVLLHSWKVFSPLLCWACSSLPPLHQFSLICFQLFTPMLTPCALKICPRSSFADGVADLQHGTGNPWCEAASLDSLQKEKATCIGLFHLEHIFVSPGVGYGPGGVCMCSLCFAACKALCPSVQKSQRAMRGDTAAGEGVRSHQPPSAQRRASALLLCLGTWGGVPPFWHKETQGGSDSQLAPGPDTGRLRLSWHQGQAQAVMPCCTPTDSGCQHSPGSAMWYHSGCASSTW